MLFIYFICKNLFHDTFNQINIFLNILHKIIIKNILKKTYFFKLQSQKLL
jgi:hypothetical protein